MIPDKSDDINKPCVEKSAADDVQTPEGADIPITDFVRFIDSRTIPARTDIEV